MVESTSKSKAKKSKSSALDLYKDKINSLGQMPVGQSTILAYHRPNAKTLKLLKELRSVTMVISLLGVNESPQDIEALCKAEGLKFFWIELPGANEGTLREALGG